MSVSFLFFFLLLSLLLFVICCPENLRQAAAACVGANHSVDGDVGVLGEEYQVFCVYSDFRRQGPSAHRQRPSRDCNSSIIFESPYLRPGQIESNHAPNISHSLRICF